MAICFPASFFISLSAPSSPHPFLDFGVTPRLPCSERSRSAQRTEGPPLRPSVRPSVGGARWVLRTRSQTETRRAACETRRRGSGGVCGHAGRRVRSLTCREPGPSQSAGPRTGDVTQVASAPEPARADGPPRSRAPAGTRPQTRHPERLFRDRLVRAGLAGADGG